MVEIEIDSLDDGPEDSVKTSDISSADSSAEESPKKEPKKRGRKPAKKTKAEINDAVDKKKNLDKLMDSFKKSIGDRLKIGLQDKYDVIPSGSLIIDYYSGVGGYPRGRIIEIHGWEATGKSTLMTQACIEAQKLGYTPAYIDYEHAYDKKYALKQGLDPDNFYFVQPSCMEDLDDLLTGFITNGVEFVVVDSVPAMTPKKTLDGDKETLALQARYMATYIKKWNQLASKHNTCIAFINQMRANIGGMKDSKATGGNALPFYASLRLNLTPIGKESRMVEDEITGTKEKEAVANLVKVTFVKNKVGAGYKTGEFRIIIGEGIDNMHTLRTLGEKKGFITKSGAFYTYKSPFDPELVIKGQGKHGFDKNFLESPALYEDLKKAVFGDLL